MSYGFKTMDSLFRILIFRRRKEDLAAELDHNWIWKWVTAEFSMSKYHWPSPTKWLQMNLVSYRESITTRLEVLVLDLIDIPSGR